MDLSFRISTENGKLTGVDLGGAGNSSRDPLAKRAAGQIREYLAGRRRVFDLPLDIRGTDFQRRVYAALLKVPYGATVTYGRLAFLAGAPSAARAVGAAMRANPLPIVVPCHRVVAAHGLGGYTPGVGIKERLLKLEHDHATPPRGHA